MLKEIPPLSAAVGVGPSDLSADTTADRCARYTLDALVPRSSKERADQEARAPEVPPLDGPHSIGSPRL